MFATTFSRKGKKYDKKSLAEQVEFNLNIITEDENQKGKISNSQLEMF